MKKDNDLKAAIGLPDRAGVDNAVEEVLKVMGMSERDREEYFAKLPPDGTSTLLVEDLMKMPQSEGRDAMIEKAKGFAYDDFKSFDAVPKITLHNELMALGYEGLAENVREGKYD